jgi:hypothetical protein
MHGSYAWIAGKIGRIESKNVAEAIHIHSSYESCIMHLNSFACRRDRSPAGQVGKARSWINVLLLGIWSGILVSWLVR